MYWSMQPRISEGLISLESFITELTSVIFESWIFDSSKLLSNLYAMSSTDLVRGDSVAGNADLEICEFSLASFSQLH